MNTEQLEKIRAPLIGLSLGIIAGLFIIGLRSTGLLQFVELANYDIYLRLKEQQNISEPALALIKTVEEHIQNRAEWPLIDPSLRTMCDGYLMHHPREVGMRLSQDTTIAPARGKRHE